MESEHEYFRTNDMSFAAFLTMHDQECQGNDWQGKTCFWLFELNDSIDSLLESWKSLEVLVEPISYNKAVTRIKRRFFSQPPIA